MDAGPRTAGGRAAARAMPQARASEATARRTRPAAGRKQASRRAAATSAGETAADDRRVGYWLWRASILLCAVVWAGNFPFTKILEQASATPAALMATRFSVAGLAISPVLAQASNRRVVTQGAAIGVILAVGYVGQAIGLELGAGSGKSAFICSLQVVFVSVVVALRSGRVTRATGVSTLLALLGAAFLELGGVIESGGGFTVGTADMYLLLQPLCFGLSYLWIEEAMEENPKDALPCAAAQIIFCGLACGVYAVGDTAFHDTEAANALSAVSGGAQSLANTFSDVFARPDPRNALGYLAIIGTSLTIALETKALGKVPPRDASLILTMEPLFASIWAFLLLGEGLTASECIGGLLVVAACVSNEMLAEEEN